MLFPILSLSFRLALTATEAPALLSHCQAVVCHARQVIMLVHDTRSAGTRQSWLVSQASSSPQWVFSALYVNTEM